MILAVWVESERATFIIHTPGLSLIAPLTGGGHSNCDCRHSLIEDTLE